jgi:hypothetical protein
MEFRLWKNDPLNWEKNLRQEDIDINYFMTEIYRIYQKAQRDRN